MNTMTKSLLKSMENCTAAVNRIITDKGHLRNDRRRNIPGVNDDMDLRAIHNAMFGEELTLEARDLLMKVENRAPLAMLCCEGPEEDFREWLVDKMIKDFEWGSDISNFLATRIVDNDRRFKPVMDSLADFDSAEVCGVPVNDEFHHAFHLYLTSVSGMRGPLSLGNLVNTSDDLVGLLEKSALAGDDPDADHTHFLSRLSEYDKSVVVVSGTRQSLKKHTVRVGIRLWYDTGVCPPSIEQTLRRNLCKVANTIRYSNMYMPMLKLHFDVMHGMRPCIESKMIDAMRLCLISRLTLNSIHEIYDAAEERGADIGFMLDLYDLDPSHLVDLRSFMDEWHEYFSNGFMFIDDDGVVSRKSRNDFGSTMLHDRTPSGATVANPVKKVKVESDNDLFNSLFSDPVDHDDKGSASMLF
jgi:hypothetical protein